MFVCRWRSSLTLCALQEGRAVSSSKLLLERAEAYMHVGQLHEALADAASVIKHEKSNIRAYQVRPVCAFSSEARLPHF